MINKPSFKSKYNVELIPGEGAFLLSESENFLLDGPVLTQVLPLINGVNTTDEIIKALSGLVSQHVVIEALQYLESEGHLEESSSFLPPYFAAFWSEMGCNISSLPEIIRNRKVKIIGLDNISSEPLSKILTSFGIQVSEDSDLIIVLVNDYLNPYLSQINSYCHDNSIPWLLLKPTGVILWIGPLFLPSKTACWSCLSQRLLLNREAESFLISRKNLTTLTQSSKARVGIIESQAYSIASIQILRFLISGQNASLESKIIVSDVVTCEFTSHNVVKRPQCLTCGHNCLSAKNTFKIEDNSDTLTSFVDGGSRAEPPEITFRKFEHHISPITGIVKNIVPSFWHSSSPIRTYSAGHNFALKNDSLYFLKKGLRSSSSGKGRNDAQAKTSALCEALERYSGVFQGEEDRLTSSFSDLNGAAIHPNNCMLFSDKQFDMRDQLNEKGSRFQTVPNRFNETAKIEWSPIYSLSQGVTKYLPTSYLYYGYPTNLDQFYCWADSNGNAAGLTPEDAILQGLLELIERDSVCLWWYNRIRRPKVNLDSFNDKYFSELKEFYHKLDREFWVLDLTSDTKIPSFAAINRRINGPSEDIIMGFGAHVDPYVAAIRAVTEMNQFIPAVLNPNLGSETVYQFNDIDAIWWWKNANIENQPYLVPNELEINYPPIEKYRSINSQLSLCVENVHSLNLEILLLNQTRPDINLNVFKVLVPGLRHFWARFAPGRIYQTPKQLGWVSSESKEIDLNPIPMFI